MAGEAPNAYANDEAPSPDEQGPIVDEPGQKRPARVGTAPAKELSQQQAAGHTAMLCTVTAQYAQPDTEPKRQRTATYAAVAAAATSPTKPLRLAAPYLPSNAPINTPLHTPNGTKGFYSGEQSLHSSPGGTNTVAVYMERGGEITTERIELSRLHQKPTN